MDIRVLKTLIESDSDYFIIESVENYRSFMGGTVERKLVLISLPETFKKICREKNMDTITVKEMEIFKDTYIDTNIFIFPVYSPFQLYQRVLYNATECLPVKGFDLAKLISSDFKTIWDVKEYINSLP